MAVSPTGDRIYVTDGAPTAKVHVFDKDGKQIATITMPKRPR